REGVRALETTWDDAIAGLAQALGRFRSDEIGILASAQMSNEDLFVLARLAAHLGTTAVDFRVPSAKPGDEDNLLIRADKNPNSQGALLCGLAPGASGGDAGSLVKAAAAGRIKLLWVFNHDLFQSALPAADVEKALASVTTLVFQGTN